MTDFLHPEADRLAKSRRYAAPVVNAMAAAAECVVPAAVMATAEMHTTEAIASPK